MSWRAVLEGAGEPKARVDAARERGLAEPARAVAELGALAAERAVPARTRALALAAAGRIAAHADVALPDLIDTVGDDDVIAAALALGMPDALTGVISQLPDGTYERIVRKLVGYRLIAAGVLGPHVARVLIDAGELDGAARAIADDFVVNVLHGVRTPSRVALAWGSELAAQVDRHGARFAEALRACLARRQGAIDALLHLLEQLGDASASARAQLGRRQERN